MERLNKVQKELKNLGEELKETEKILAMKPIDIFNYFLNKDFYECVQAWQKFRNNTSTYIQYPEPQNKPESYYTKNDQVSGHFTLRCELKIREKFGFPPCLVGNLSDAIFIRQRKAGIEICA